MTHLMRQRVTSAGLALAILSSLIAMSACGRALVSGPGRVPGVQLVINLPTATIGVFVVAALMLVALLVMGAVWAKLVGAAVVFGLAGTEALMVIIAKTSTRFHPGAAIHLESAGRILGIAFIVAIVGLVCMIVGSRELIPAPGSEALDAAGLPVRPGSASVALGFSLLGVIFFPVAPVGVILGLIVFGQITQSRESVPGRTLTLTAIVVGTAWTSLWTILVFATGIYSSHPI